MIIQFRLIVVNAVQYLGSDGLIGGRSLLVHTARSVANSLVSPSGRRRTYRFVPVPVAFLLIHGLKIINIS